MPRLLALGEERIAALAHSSAKRMCRCCCGRRALPRANASAVHEGRVEMAIVARTREDVGSDLRRVSHHRR